MQLQAVLRIIDSLSKLKSQSDIFDARLNVSECPLCISMSQCPNVQAFKKATLKRICQQMQSL